MTSPRRRPDSGRRSDALASDTTELVADSAYGLMQAAGEYLDHVRTAPFWETRLNRTLIS